MITTAKTAKYKARKEINRARTSGEEFKFDRAMGESLKTRFLPAFQKNPFVGFLFGRNSFYFVAAEGTQELLNIKSFNSARTADIKGKFAMKATLIEPRFKLLPSAPHLRFNLPGGELKG